MNRSNDHPPTLPTETAQETEGCEHPPTERPLGLPPDPATLEQAAEFLRAAGDASRLRLLAELQHGERCVSDLAALTGEGMSTVSQRLKVLRTAGLVNRRRDHKHILYFLADDHIVQFIRNALDHARELATPRRQRLTPTTHEQEQQHHHDS